MNELVPKTVAQLLDLDNFELHYQSLIGNANTEPEMVLRLLCLLERMIASVIEETFIAQLETSHDLGLLTALRKKIIKRYWSTKAWDFLTLLYQSGTDLGEIPLHDGLVLDDIRSEGKSDPLFKAKAIRNFIAHNADIAFDMTISEIAIKTNTKIESDEIIQAVHKAIHVLHDIYAIVPLSQYDTYMDAIASDQVFENRD